MSAAERLDMDADAERFQCALGGRFTFQTFDDSGRKDKRLSRVLHDTLSDHGHTLTDLNARGAGVFVMVNEGDGRGRSSGNVQRIRAYFVDLDGAPLAPVQAAPLPPHCIIESSPSRWHAYWLVEGAPPETFKPVQLAIARRFDGDPTVKDLPRVMRLPGFLHRKDKPFQTRIVELRDAPRYTHAEFVRAFDIDLNASADERAQANQRRATVTPLRKRALPEIITEGERNAALLSWAGGLVRQGFGMQALNDRLQRVNAERCQPPLCASEVDSIAAHAAAYGSEGFTKLPHKLLDSSEWKALAPPAHDIVLTAFRRFNGANNRNLALTWTDFKGLPGFGDQATFYKHRAAVLREGILRVAQPGRNSQQGRKPDLLAIADRFLPVSPTRKIPAGANPKITQSFIDKQSVCAVGGKRA